MAFSFNPATRRRSPTFYGVTTKALNHAVKRSRDRFPADFMFQITIGDWDAYRSQTVTASYAAKLHGPDTAAGQPAAERSGPKYRNGVCVLAP